MKKETGLLLIVFSVLLCTGGYAQTKPFEQQQFERLAHEYGDVSYVAWLSVLRGVSNGLPAGVADMYYDETQFPFELAYRFTSVQKDKVKKEVVGYLHLQTSGRQEVLFQRTESWLLAWQQWNICMKLTSLEETVAALYGIEPGLSMFQYVIKNRGFKKGKIAGSELASSMSSAEISGLQYEVLDEWSAFSRKKMLGIFTHMMKLSQ